MNAFVITGFVLGLSSSLHCLGMCGPIAMAIPVDRSSNFKMASGALQYNLGRILTYSILGAIVGTFGMSFELFGILQWLSIATGIFLVLYAWRKYLTPRFHMKFGSIQGFLNRFLGKAIRSKSPFKLASLGLLNGLLPCGMVFAAMLNALLTGTPGMSALAMASFGLGTLPAMIAVTFAAKKINFTHKRQWSRVVPYVLSIIGLMIVLRGMNLNIPYLSPKIELRQEIANEKDVEQNIEMSCCHEKSSCD